ncbi:MAG: LptF/LptG family permease [Lacipirellulaceae bacterium]
MRIIDRYLLWQYVQVFLICFVSLAGLYTVIDAFSKLDDFVGDGRPVQDALAEAGRYYALQSITFFNRTSGVLAMIAAMFTVTWAQRHNEMTALMAAGLPRLRVLRPVLIASLAVAAGAAVLRETVLPGMRHELSLDSKDLRAEHGVEFPLRFDNVSDVSLGGASAMIKTRTIVRPAFGLPPAFARLWGKSIIGQGARYLAPEGDRPAGYLLYGVTQPEGIDEREMLRLASGQPVAVTRRDAAWLEPGQVFVASGVSFELLASGTQWRDLASTQELVRELASPSTDLGPDVRVAIHSRMVQPVLDLTLLMLGLPLVVSRGARSPLLALGLSVVIVTGFFVVTLGGQALGATGWLKPSLAAWLPVIVFVPVAAALGQALRE